MEIAASPAPAGNGAQSPTQSPAPQTTTPTVTPTPKPKVPEPKKEPVPGGKPEEKKDEPPKRYKLRTLEDGKEIDEEYDETTLRRLVQKGKTSDKRFEEAAKLAKDAKRIIDEARTPEKRREAIAELLGSEKEVTAFAESILADRLRDVTLTPEEREQAAAMRELEQLRAEKKTSAERQKKEAEAATARELEQRLEKTVVGLTKAAGLPEDAAWARELVADVLAPIVEHGIPATTEDIVAEVREAVSGRAKQRDQLLIANLEGPALLEYLGPANIKRILAATVKAHAPKPPELSTTTQAETPKRVDIDGKDRFITPSEFAARQRELGAKAR